MLPAEAPRPKTPADAFLGLTVKVGLLSGTGEDMVHLSVAERLRVDRVAELEDGTLVLTQINGPESSFTVRVDPLHGTIERALAPGEKSFQERMADYLLGQGR